jgi:hypothetical protein
MPDPPPTLDALFGGLGKMLLCTLRNDRSDGGNAQFSCLLDCPLHAIKLEDRHYERNGQRGIGLNFGNQIEANFVWRDRRDFGVKHVTACNYILRASNRGSSFVPMFSNPAASRHCLSTHSLSCKCIPSPETPRGTLEAPPLSVAFLLVEPLLLLLRGLLYGLLGCLLRGCLLGCFLGCHLPILPFRWVASMLQYKLQLMNV